MGRCNGAFIRIESKKCFLGKAAYNGTIRDGEIHIFTAYFTVETIYKNKQDEYEKEEMAPFYFQIKMRIEVVKKRRYNKKNSLRS
jgi:hypothetical protein